MNKYNSLKTDLYELTMAAGYFQHKISLQATFEMYCHTMPPNRSYLITCGLQQVVEYLLSLHFSDEDIQFLKKHPSFKSLDPKFFSYLKRFKFTGDLWAIPEGEICFAHEPLLQIEAPIIEAQILETYLLSTMNIETLVATKAARVCQAACADGKQRTVVDFGSRRAHGPQAAILAARAAYIGGCVGTSNVFSGKMFDIPTFGTMAHSWIQAFGDEAAAFNKYNEVFPNNTILLVDTYDTIAAIKKAIDMDSNMQAIRIDSGNLKTLSRNARRILDEHGLSQVKIIASGNLNEYKIRELVRAKAPIDMFGVGTDMVVSRDVPALDLTYKLVQAEDQAGYISYKAKRSQGKQTMPGRKQVFRRLNKRGQIGQDRIVAFSEKPKSNERPLLKQIIKQGRLLHKLPTAKQVRQKTQKSLSQLPKAMLETKALQKIPVEYSRKLLEMKRQFRVK